jgi:hypothetical protein
MIFAVLITPTNVCAEDNAIWFIAKQKNNIFVGDKAHLEIKTDQSNIVSNKKCSVEIKDEQGKSLSKSPIDLRVEHPTIEINNFGYYSVEVLEDASSASVPKSLGKTSVAVLPPMVGDTNNPFGLWHVHGDPDTGLKAGAHWTRLLRTLNAYKLDASGEILSNPKAKTIAVPAFPGYAFIDTLAYGLPDFLKNNEEKSSQNLYPPKDWQVFEKLIEQLLKDIPYVPEYFSVYNEPENTWQGSDQELVKFLGTIARVVKRVHPETKVLGPGLATIKIARLRNLAKLGLFDYLDGVATNAYSEVGKPEGEFIRRVRDLKNLLAEVGRTNMPIYITEYGWTSSPGTWQQPVDELTQARYVARSLALLRNEEVNAAIYFCLRYTTRNVGEEGFSVTRADGTPKPAYVAFATASRMIGRDGISSLIEGDDGSRLFQLHSKNKFEAVIVAWKPDSDRGVFVSGEFAKSVVDMMGRSLDVTETFKVGESPLYFVPKVGLNDVPKVLTRQIVRRGELVSSEILQYVYIPKPLRIVNKKQIEVPTSTPLGTYWLISDVGNRVTIFPLVVTD